MTVRSVQSSTLSADSPLYGISPLLLSDTFRLRLDVAERWRRRLLDCPSDAAVIARYVRHDLGVFDPTWMGWLCKDGLLWPMDGLPASPSQVTAIPFMRDQLREYERAQRWMLEHAFGDYQREKAISEASDFLQRAIEALRQR